MALTRDSAPFFLSALLYQTLPSCDAHCHSLSLSFILSSFSLLFLLSSNHSDHTHFLFYFINFFFSPPTKLSLFKKRLDTLFFKDYLLYIFFLTSLPPPNFFSILVVKAILPRLFIPASSISSSYYLLIFVVFSSGHSLIILLFARVFLDSSFCAPAYCLSSITPSCRLVVNHSFPLRKEKQELRS